MAVVGLAEGAEGVLFACACVAVDDAACCAGAAGKVVACLETVVSSSSISSTGCWTYHRSSAAKLPFLHNRAVFPPL